MISKFYGIDYATTEEFLGKHMAYTLNAEEVTDVENPVGGQLYSMTHSDGWTVTAVVHEDYYTWVNEFKSSHPVYGKVWGDFEHFIFADTEEGYNNFIANHPPHLWDYWDI